MTEYTSKLTVEERAALIARVRELGAERRAQEGEESASDRLSELEEDNRAGRIVRFDVRCAPDEKIRWAQAAFARGLSTAELVRSVMADACDEILEPVQE